MKTTDQSIVGRLSLPLQVLLTVCSGAGIYSPLVYTAMDAGWLSQTRLQDIFNLVIILPLHLLFSWYAAKGSRRCLGIWAGINSYLAYTFAIYCFDVHLNYLFLYYCIILSLSVYSVLFFFYTVARENGIAPGRKQWRGVTAILFLAISILTFALWARQIWPVSGYRVTLADLQEYGLPTNPVHVLDLALMLPALFITGVWLIRRRSLAEQVAPALAVFTVLMAMTIAWMLAAQKADGFAVSTELMVLLAVMCLAGAWWVRGLTARNTRPVQRAGIALSARPAVKPVRHQHYDPVLNDELQELYLQNRRYRAELDFLMQELYFLNKLCHGTALYKDGHVPPAVNAQLNLLTRQNQELEKLVARHERQLAQLLKGSSRLPTLELIEQHARISNGIRDSFADAAKLKLQLYGIIDVSGIQPRLPVQGLRT